MSATQFVGWLCAFCTAENETEVDMSAGQHQEYIEDCIRCCRPNLLAIEIDTKTQEILLEAHSENE
jgi:Cysteine-rich CPXCG